MADAHHENGIVVPTALALGEKEFPFPNVATSASSKSPSLGSSTVNGTVHSNNTHDNITEATHERRWKASETASPPHLEKSDSPDPRPKPLQKSMTERPAARTKASSFLFGKRGVPTSDKPLKLTKQPTLTFDPYSDSDSSSSSEDQAHDTAATKAKEHEDHETSHERKRKHRRGSSPGPFSNFKIASENFSTKGRVSKRDGRLRISINETINSGYFAKTLGAGLRKHFKSGSDGTHHAQSAFQGLDAEAEKIPPEDDDMEHDPDRRIKLNICIIVIGSRGDIQPFLKIGKILKEDYGHRVRIATHPAFKKFVEEDSGLEFFSVGGDPSELMAFMVKNPGLIPSMDTVRAGEIGKRRAAMYEMFQGMWRACTNSTDDETDKANMKMMGEKPPFIADAIIANPPSFAPPHIAERLGVPLHMMFTFPYSPTEQFPHPLANIKASNVDTSYVNFMSYPLVEMMTWQGLGDLINRFRVKTLCLDEVSTLWAPGQLYRLKVPYTYMWSPSLVPKPQDWGTEIDIAGFVFLELASSFKPPDSLTKFLDAGPPPIYIGFGSIVVDDPDRFTKLIFDAVEMAGVRALVSKGWGGLGDESDMPENIFMLENTPHDWLFPRVQAVVHHGGAGTTAIGLKCGKPTMIVPFFGDQPFWGSMVSKAKAGAHECIPYKKLTAERLAEGIKQCLTDEAKEAVERIAKSIAKEGDGAKNAVRSFHRSLPLKVEQSMRCQILDNRVAAWRLKNTSVRLSPLAAELLVEWKKIHWSDLKLLRHYEWNDFGGPGEPVTGGWGALIGSTYEIASGLGFAPVKMAKSIAKREELWERRQIIKKKQKRRKKAAAQANENNSNAMPNGHNTANGNLPSASSSDKPGPRPSAPQRQSTTLSTLSKPDDALAIELAQEATHSFRKSGSALLKAPMHFTLAIMQGFHNAPRLYGDETVRRPPRVTGLHSGLRAGKEELIYGVRDGVSGLWMHPYRGAREGGLVGFAVGVGMGVGGLVLKDIAAGFGIPAYTMKGIHEEAVKGRQPTGRLRKARIVQGRKEVDGLVDMSGVEQRGGDSQNDLRRRDNGENGKTGHDKNERGGAEKEKPDQQPPPSRQTIESTVLQHWNALQPQITIEKSHNKSGLCGSLLGRKVRKEGFAVPRKPIHSSTRPSMENDETKPKKTTSAPLEPPALNGHANLAGQERKRAGTAPGTSMGWKEKIKRKNRVENVPGAVKDEERRAGVGNRKEAQSVDFAKTDAENTVPVAGLGNGHLTANRRPGSV